VATTAGERDTGTELAGAVHQVLAILTDLRSHAQAPELSDRIALVHWLRQELAAVEILLTDAYSRTTADLTGAPSVAAH
jgi:hypothetical protein